MFSEKVTHWKLIEYAMNSDCDRVVIPLQDVLGLDSKYRFNTPGTLSEDNWVWRFSFDDLSNLMIDRMRKITEDSNRLKYIKEGETI